MQYWTLLRFEGRSGQWQSTACHSRTYAGTSSRCSIHIAINVATLCASCIHTFIFQLSLCSRAMAFSIPSEFALGFKCLHSCQPFLFYGVLHAFISAFYHSFLYSRVSSFCWVPNGLSKCWAGALFAEGVWSRHHVTLISVQLYAI